MWYKESGKIHPKVPHKETQDLDEYIDFIRKKCSSVWRVIPYEGASTRELEKKYGRGLELQEVYIIEPVDKSYTMVVGGREKGKVDKMAIAKFEEPKYSIYGEAMGGKVGYMVFLLKNNVAKHVGAAEPTELTFGLTNTCVLYIKPIYIDVWVDFREGMEWSERDLR